jgi:hypothetical protein
MARAIVNSIVDNQKNYLINGNFDFWQRATSFSSPGNVYLADRWKNFGSAGTITISKQTSNAPTNSSSYLSIAHGSSGAFISIGQALESYNLKLLSGKTITFSLLLARNSTMNGDMLISVKKRSTADLSGVFGDWTDISTITIPNASIPVLSSSSTWSRFSVTVPVPSDGTANGLLLVLYYSGAPASGSAVYMTQATLNEGGIAAPFSLSGGDIATELIRCQRYLQPVSNFVAYGISTVAVTANAPLKPTMRATPGQPTDLGISGGMVLVNASFNAGQSSFSASANCLPNGVQVNLSNYTGITAGAFYTHNLANNANYMLFDAEI